MPAAAHDPTPGSDCDAVFSFKFENDTQITVEYARPSRGASLAGARQAWRSLTTEGEPPPRRVIVGRDGTAHVREP